MRTSTASLVLLLPFLVAAGWPSLSLPPLSEGGGANDAALVVAVEDYWMLPDIPGAVANASDWTTWLKSTRGVGLVKTLTNTDVTRENLLQETRQVAQRVKPGGTVWLVFIGHGAPSADGKDGVLVAADAQLNPNGLYANAVSRTEILAAIEGGPQASTVVVLDACFSGKGTDGQVLMSGLQPALLSGTWKSGRATILAAAKADQFAGPLPGLGRPAFSYLVLGALRGWGDQDGNGSVTAREAVTYADETLYQAVVGRSQTPEILGVTPEIILARPKKPERKPALPTAATDTVPTSDLDRTLAELEAARKARLEAEARQAAAAEAERKATAALEVRKSERIEAASKGVRTQATAHWAQVKVLLDAGGPEGQAAAQAFVDQYSQATVTIQLDGRDITQSVAVPEVDEARRRLASVAEKSLSKASAPPAAPWASPTAPVTAPASETERKVLVARDLETQQPAEYRDLARQKRTQSMTFLKDLLKQGTVQGDQKAEMLLRLADLYYEEGRDFSLDGKAAESRTWLDKSIKLYQQILENYPQYQRADEATFYLASAYRETDQQDLALQEYSRLVRTYPQSRYVPDAYVQIGEHYFGANNAYKALVAYQKAAAYKEHPLYGFTLYKLAWCYYSLGEYGKAIDTMKTVVAHSAGGSSPNRLQDEAFYSLTRFYVTADQEDEAFAYFNKLGKKDLILSSLEQLARTFSNQGKYEQAIQTWRRLIQEDPRSKDAPRYQEEIIQCTSRTGKKAETLQEIDTLVKTYGPQSAWARANASNQEALAAARDAIERQLRTMATNTHAEARKAGTTQAAEQLYALAYKSYTIYLEQCPQSKYVGDVRYAFGELLYKIKKYDEAWVQYMAVVALDPSGPNAKFCAESAVFAADEMVKKTGGSGTGPLTEWERKKLEALRQFVRLYPTDTKADSMKSLLVVLESRDR